MKVGMGSKNKTKVAALEDMLRKYPMFEGAEVIGVDAVTDVYGHPKSIDETVEGAIQRAKKAYEGHEYGFGIEGGLMKVPHTKSGSMEVAACAIYDGKRIHLGLSPALEWPLEMHDSIMNKGLDGSQAMQAAGLSQEEKPGEGEGIIGLLTNSRMTRTDYNKIAIMMALTHLEHPEFF